MEGLLCRFGCCGTASHVFFFGRWQRHAVSETFSAKAALSQEFFDGTLLEQQCH